MTSCSSCKSSQSSFPIFLDRPYLVVTKEFKRKTLAYDPKLLAPMRKVYRDLHQRLEEDDLPNGVAGTVLAAIDGLWLWWVLGLKRLNQSLVNRTTRLRWCRFRGPRGLLV